METKYDVLMKKLDSLIFDLQALLKETPKKNWSSSSEILGAFENIREISRVFGYDLHPGPDDDGNDLSFCYYPLISFLPEVAVVNPTPTFINWLEHQGIEMINLPITLKAGHA